MDKKTVCVGMSGGVDSSVAAYLLKQQGYQVIGVTMQIWQDEETETISENGGCCGLSAVDDARRVAAQLEIPYYVMNFKEDFRKYVNRYVKWESLLRRSLSIGGDYIATGHYARVVRLSNGRYTLKVAKGIEKDQTYALYNLTQYQLSKTLMPVGEYNKTQIRQIASDIGIRVADKPDSQDICFIPDGDYAAYLEQKEGLKAVPGHFVDLNGTVLGEHKGIFHYTVGQRKGLGLSMGHPVFVVDIVPETNEVVIGENADTFAKELIADKTNFMSVEKPEDGMQVTAKIRYAHKGAPCRIYMMDEDRVRVVFDEPVRAATKGQAVVFYEDDYIVGGGTITEIVR